MTNEITVIEESKAPAIQGMPQLTIQNMLERRELLVEATSSFMKEGLHYGKVPGIPKPFLQKPGAEALRMFFGYTTSYKIDERNFEGGHREFLVTCSVYKSGELIGQGVGSCSTLEKKYRYRGSDHVSTGRPVPQEYWKSRDQSLLGEGMIHSKVDGQWMICKKGEPIENPDIADQYNTVLKMAKKRAEVDATITTTGASEYFMQDEDYVREQVAIKQSSPVPKNEDVKSAAIDNEVAYALPYESNTLNVHEWRARLKNHGFKWDAGLKLWRGNVIFEELMNYMQADESGGVPTVGAGGDSFDPHPDEYADQPPTESYNF
jgi:hypothetical protein